MIAISWGTHVIDIGAHIIGMGTHVHTSLTLVILKVRDLFNDESPCQHVF